MNKQKSLASISLDLDNLWSYLKIHGDTGWENFPSYLNVFVPYLLDILKNLDLKITFFIVGQDAALNKNREALKAIGDSGHEVGNHSFNHESWLHLYEKDKMEREVLAAEQHIIRVTGQKPIGFRGPGFSWSPSLLAVLSKNGYLYDASTLPTYIGPLARFYYFWISNLTKEEKQERDGLFGHFKDGLRSVKPYYWEMNENTKLLEIPVTTIPLLKIPFHLSYLLYLSRYSIKLMDLYLNLAISLCRITNTEPSFLLHPLDLIGGDQVPELAFFPGMDISSQAKVGLFYRVIRKLEKNFKLVSLNTYAQSILKQDQIKVMKLNLVSEYKMCYQN